MSRSTHFPLESLLVRSKSLRADMKASLGLWILLQLLQCNLHSGNHRFQSLAPCLPAPNCTDNVLNATLFVINAGHGAKL
jgi:hypothetical protein